jgi:hypothetical protein
VRERETSAWMAPTNKVAPLPPLEAPAEAVTSAETAAAELSAAVSGEVSVEPANQTAGSSPKTTPRQHHRDGADGERFAKAAPQVMRVAKLVSHFANAETLLPHVGGVTPTPTTGPAGSLQVSV